MEESASALERLMTAVIDGVPMFISAKDLEGRYLFANVAFMEMMGKTSAELVGSHFGAFFAAADRLRLEAHDRRVLSSGESITEELTLPSALSPESPRTFRVNTFPLRTRAGAIYGVCAVGGDITESMAIEAERSRNLDRKRLIG